MKITIKLLLALLLTCNGYGQTIILPGDQSINTSLIKSGITTLGYFIESNGELVDVGTYEIEIEKYDGKLAINSTFFFKDSDKEWNDNCTVDANTFQAIKYTSDRDQRKYELNFSKAITGEFLDKNNGEKSAINISIKEKFFDINSYSHFIGALPLKLGYRAIIPVYDYEAADKTKIYEVLIKEVKSDIFKSTLTGAHDVWKVSVFEESSGHNYDFFIDKGNRRLWKIDILSKEGNIIKLFDKESDYNPMTQKFNKEDTVKMISDGNSTIKGQVFGRANKNDESWVTVVNWNPKQVAKKGTSVFLIPYSNWYKEYFEVNKQLKKEGRKYNMPKDALECVLVSTVYDDDGHFEFVNLMPGEYVVYSQFEFYENHHQDVVIGTRDHYLGNSYQGSSDITQRNRYSQKEMAFAEEIVTISNDGDAMEIKLKKQNKSKIY